MTAAGALKHRLILQRLVKTPQDTIGGHESRWRNIARIWAAIDTKSEVEFRLSIRHPLPVQKGDRFLWGNCILDVESQIHNGNEPGGIQHFLCRMRMEKTT